MEPANIELLRVVLAANGALVLEEGGNAGSRPRHDVPPAWTPPEPPGRRLAAARRG